MSAPTAAEETAQTSEPPQEAAQAVQPENKAETQTQTQTVQAPIQAEGDIAIDENFPIDDSTSDYSDEM